MNWPYCCIALGLVFLVAPTGLAQEPAISTATIAREGEDFFFTPAGYQQAGLSKLIAGGDVARLKISVIDATTGAPTPCRVAVVGADGHYYQPPKNRLTPYAMTGRWPNPGDWGNRPGKAPWRYLGRYFYMTGESDVDVPPGETRIEVSKGWEFAPQVLTVQCVARTEQPVQISLSRSVPREQLGYVSGDIHLHFPRASRADDQVIFDLLEAEDIPYGFTLAYNEPAGPYLGAMDAMDSPQFRAFGPASQRSRGAYRLMSGQEYRSVHYGHIMYYLHDRIVHETRKFNIDDGPVFGQTSAEVMGRGGLAIMAHGGYSQEIYADVALGTLNGVELLQFGIYRELGLSDWYHMLNSGFRLPAFGACDFPACRFLGDARTYVWTAAPNPTAATQEQWLRAAAAGQSFMSTGPLLLLEVDGHRPGEMIAADGKEPIQLKVDIRARCEVTPLQFVDLIVNGQVVERLKVTPGQALGQWSRLEHELSVDRSSWVAARAWSITPGGQPDAESHTNPVYINFNNRRAFEAASLDAWLKKLDQQIAVHSQRAFAEKAAVLAYFQNARDVLLKIRAGGGFPVDVESWSLLADARQAEAVVGRLDVDQQELKEYLRPTPALAVSEAEQAFEVVQGFRMTTVAAEPLVTDPVAAAFDENGQLYVCEMRDYPFKPAQGKPPLGSLRLLRDTDGDGQFDQSTVFADELLWAAGVAPWRGGVFVAASPDIWYLKDVDGDGQADVRQRVFTGFGTGNQQGMVNNLQFGLDHWIYGSTGPNGGMISKPDDPTFTPVPIQGRDFRFHPETLEFQAITGTVQFGNTFDDFGNRFTCSESQPLQHILMPEHYVARNPFLPAAKGIHNIAPGPVPIFRISPVERWREIRSWRRIQKNERPATAAGASHHVIDAAAGVTIYRGGAYPADWYGQAFIPDGQNNVIHRRKLVPDGLTFASERVDTDTEVVRSHDIWFRPVNSLNAPDGTLYFLDMSREVLESIHIPLDVAQHLDFKHGREHGRIYRLEPPGFQVPEAPRLSQATTAQVVACLSSPHGWFRDTAQRLLFERQDVTVVPELRRLLAKAPLAVTRLQALYALSGLQRLTAEDVLLGLRDTHPGVCEHAMRLSEPLLTMHEAVLYELVKLSSSAEPRLRFQAAFSLGEASHPAATQALAQLACSADNDWLRIAVLSSIGKSDASRRAGKGSQRANVGTRAGDLLAELLQPKLDSDSAVRSLAQSAEQLSDVLRPLAQLIGARNDPSEIARTLDVLRSVPTAELAEQLLLALGVGMSSVGKQLMPSDFSEASRDWLESLSEAAVQRAVSSELADEQRMQAVKLACCFDGGKQQLKLLELVSPVVSEALQLAVLRSWGNDPEQRLAKQLLKHWGSHTPSVRQHALRWLLSRHASCLLYLKAAEEHNFSVAELDSIQREMLLQHPESEIRELAEPLLARTQSLSRQAVLADYEAVLQAQGDVKRGSAVFSKHCAACHQLGGQGTPVGPNLSANATQSAQALLTHILDPNQYVAPNYVVYQVLDKHGRAHTGLLGAQNANSVTLRREQGEAITLLRSEIEEIVSRRVSLMPEGLEQVIPPGDMADLLAYLQEATKKSPGDPYSERDRGTIAGTLVEE